MRTLLIASSALIAGFYSMSQPAPAPQKKVKQYPLFESDSILNLEIRGNLRSVMRDREDDAEYHYVDLLAPDTAGKTEENRIRVRCRGNFRRSRANCEYPPLWINLPKDSISPSSLFANLNKVKLVMPCTDPEYIIREYMVYKVYNLFTPYSFRVRLVNLTFRDSSKLEKPDRFYGILLEPEEIMAKRNGFDLLEKKGVNSSYIIPSEFHRMAVFQFFAGNTDWSLPFLHNIKLISSDTSLPPIPVPYDFDHTGLVNASYAYPAEELKLPSVRVRRYRGYCLDDYANELAPVFAMFKEKRPQIEALYQNQPGLSETYVKSSLRYIDDFYKLIDNPKKAKMEFNYPCAHKDGGEVQIKGLNN